jgi:RND family efflux transporter MFP subunit
MKKFVIIILALTVAACGKDTGRDEIRKQIAQYKKQKNELQQKIDRLNERLSGMEGETGGSFKVPVLVKKMKPDTFNHYINANGSVEAIQEAFISPETNGQITEILVEEGNRVEKGELMVKLNTSVIRSNIEEVKTNLELARKTYMRQKRLWEDSVGTEMQYLEAKNRKESLENRLQTLKEQLDMAEIRAPFGGIVEEINQKVGELGTPGIQILHLVNLKKLRVEAELAEQYMSSVKEGDLIRIRFPAYSALEKEVPITRKGSVIDKESRTFTIEARINNYNEKIKPNQISLVSVNDYSSDSALYVPSNVIKQDMEGDYVYILKEDGNKRTAHKVYVETGRSYNNQTLITKGIKPGDEVITSGYTQVSEGSEVSVKQKEAFVDQKQ